MIFRLGLRGLEHELTLFAEMCPWNVPLEGKRGQRSRYPMIEQPDILFFHVCLQFTLVALTQ